MPKVSVIIPVYGVEKYIERCARSLFEQTLGDIEFIFVDDCTIDKSIGILKSIIKQYPERENQIHIVHHEKNAGLPKARQTGIKYAKGDYIAHCDSDDWVDRDMYRAMYIKAIEEKADMVVCDYYRSDGNNHKGDTGFIATEKEQFIKEMLYLRTSWAVWNKIVKRELYHLEFVYPTGAMGEDMLISTQLALVADKIVFLRKRLYYYYDNPLSISNVASYESTVIKFKQGTENARLLEQQISKRQDSFKYKNAMSYAMHFEKCMLLPFLRNDDASKLFYSTFKNAESIVLGDTTVTLKDRLRCVLIKTHLYTIVSKIIRG